MGSFRREMNGSEEQMASPQRELMVGLSTQSNEVECKYPCSTYIIMDERSTNIYKYLVHGSGHRFHQCRIVAAQVSLARERIVIKQEVSRYC